MTEVDKSVAVQVCWLAPEQGGRQHPITGDVYWPTARFAGDTELFSVIMTFPRNSEPNPAEGELRLLFPDLREIQDRLQPGTELEITEGNRAVARCRIVA